MLPHGIEVTSLTKRVPGNNLPEWVKEAAESRGYGDSKYPLSLVINDDDIAAAFKEAAEGNGAACVMAQAGTRLGAQSVYFYRSTAWVDFGTGPIVRYQTSKDIYNHVIRPFDKSDRANVRPGIYHLTAPTSSRTLKHGRTRDHSGKRDGNNPRPELSKPRPYMGRVVMARQPAKKRRKAAAA